jgi:hypothetical protein
MMQRGPGPDAVVVEVAWRWNDEEVTASQSRIAQDSAAVIDVFWYPWCCFQSSGGADTASWLGIV